MHKLHTNTTKKEGKNVKEKDLFIERLRSIQCAGNVSVTCQQTGLARRTVYVWREKDPEFALEWDAALRECVETQIDETEQALRKAVLDGNITAIIFKLKSLKPQVYGDKVEFKGSNDQGPPLKAGFVQALERLLNNIKADESSRLSHQ